MKKSKPQVQTYEIQEQSSIDHSKSSESVSKDYFRPSEQIPVKVKREQVMADSESTPISKMSQLEKGLQIPNRQHTSQSGLSEPSNPPSEHGDKSQYQAKKEQQYTSPIFLKQNGVPASSKDVEEQEDIISSDKSMSSRNQSKYEQPPKQQVIGKIAPINWDEEVSENNHHSAQEQEGEEEGVEEFYSKSGEEEAPYSKQESRSEVAEVSMNSLPHEQEDLREDDEMQDSQREQIKRIQQLRKQKLFEQRRNDSNKKELS